MGNIASCELHTSSSCLKLAAGASATPSLASNGLRASSHAPTHAPVDVRYKSPPCLSASSAGPMNIDSLEGAGVAQSTQSGPGLGRGGSGGRQRCVRDAAMRQGAGIWREVWPEP